MLIAEQLAPRLELPIALRCATEAELLVEPMGGGHRRQRQQHECTAASRAGPIDASPCQGLASSTTASPVGDRDHRYWVYDFTPDRSGDGPARFFQDDPGYLQADAYSGYDALFQGGTVIEVGCWAHARRKFHEARTTDPQRAHQDRANGGSRCHIAQLGHVVRVLAGLRIPLVRSGGQRADFLVFVGMGLPDLDATPGPAHASRSWAANSSGWVTGRRQAKPRQT